MSIIQSRQSTETNAHRELSNLALAIAGQTDRSFQSVELVQRSLVAQFQSAGLRDRGDYARLAATEDLHRALQDKISGLPQVDAVSIVDARGKLLNSSRAWPVPDIDLSDRDYFRALANDPTLHSFESAPIRKRQTGVWTMYLAEKVTGRDGEFLGVVLSSIRLENFEQFYASMSLGPHSAITLLRRDGVLLARYPRVESMIGRSILVESEAIRKAAQGINGTTRQISPLDGKDRFVSTRGLVRYPLIVVVGEEAERIFADWQVTSLSCVIGTALIDILIALAVYLGMRQMREQRRLASVSHRAARHDPLTGLPNRLSLREALAERLAGDGRFSLVWIDLDRFKAVNDGFGHLVGDELLKGVADRLRTCVGPRDLVARVGGDEFALIHSADVAYDDGSETAERVLGRLSEPFHLQGTVAQVGATIGVATFPSDGSEAVDLMRSADLALYHAKAAGRGRWKCFEPMMSTRVRTQRALERDLARAVDRDELVLHYQPIVSIETGCPTGFEALLRWRHPEHGFVAPSEFIPLAETNGLIVPIGEWVIREACREAATWPGHLTIAVNLSPEQLASGRVVETVIQAIDETNLDPCRLELEITETALLQDDDAVRAALHKLRALGVHIALDDFGVGYSSLSYVTSFPFDRIKIDRSFVQKMKVSDTGLSVVCTILQLAKRLGVATTGEGVETAEHLDALREEGCTDVQGYHCGRPQSAADIRTLFRPVELRLLDAA